MELHRDSHHPRDYRARNTRRGKAGLWFRRLERLRADYPETPEFLESAHRLLRWSAIEQDIDLYLAVRGMIRNLASEPASTLD
ncbi:MAG: hypothetical protein HKP27_03385 [Myxococcales bacterium]|nr:hypothetical protein [Myxococcales bacterium]